MVTFILPYLIGFVNEKSGGRNLHLPTGAAGVSPPIPPGQAELCSIFNSYFKILQKADHTERNSHYFKRDTNNDSHNKLYSRVHGISFSEKPIVFSKNKMLLFVIYG